ncbi:MAG: hypothetical protein HLUCCA01_04560 [Bacteroidetes bacterium HLUCCA01]|nr:MAG: hypothetical protein HLUCCA01_04560 [Bacteroidetes bacterium HLUCCA01]
MLADKKLLTLLFLCNLAAVVLLLTTEAEESTPLSDWNQLDQLLLTTIQDFRQPPERVQIRTIDAHENLERKIITVDIAEGYPQTEFHRTVLQQVQQYRGGTYGLVSFPDQMLTIYIMFENTVVRTIRFREWEQE